MDKQRIAELELELEEVLEKSDHDRIQEIEFELEEANEAQD
jgi:hypothetical protein